MLSRFGFTRTAAASPLAGGGVSPLALVRQSLQQDSPTSSDLLGTLGFRFEGQIAVDPQRVRQIAVVDRPARQLAPPGAVVYWMSRDMRVADNWALLRAQQLALAAGAPLVVVKVVLQSYAAVNLRIYGFMLRNLKQVEADLHTLDIPFRLLLGDPVDQISGYVNEIGASALVADFLPLRIPQAWKAGVAARLRSGVAFEEVDAHNIVPAWVASTKQEVGAMTIRSKIHALLPKFLTPFPRVVRHPHKLPPSAEACAGFQIYPGGGSPVSSSVSSSSSSSSSSSAVMLAPTIRAPVSSGSSGGDTAPASSAPASSAPAFTDWGAVLSFISMDESVPEVTWCAPGERAAAAAALDFITHRLADYGARRNDPNQPGATSGLSAWLHFGHIAPQRVVLEVLRATGLSIKALFPSSERTAGPQWFAEELVVRRELADNYCLYNKNYDSLAGAPAWAADSLTVHSTDVREHAYTRAQFDAALTHEPLWNAAQMELKAVGKLHGYMRMYWAKKILEWSTSPAEALATALHLNDRYSLDGRDPNGYAGCAWSIAGVHDRGFVERSVFGKVRWMSLSGCKGKFDVSKYVSTHPVRPPRAAAVLPAAAAAGSSSSAAAAAGVGAAGAQAAVAGSLGGAKRRRRRGGHQSTLSF